MSLMLCFSFLLLSSARAEDPPAEESSASAESAEKTKASKVGAWLEESRTVFVKKCSVIHVYILK